jgi:cell division septum initiation protein DivIVA
MGDCYLCKAVKAKDERQRLKERIAELEAAIDEIAGYATIETPAEVTEIINRTRRNAKLISEAPAMLEAIKEAVEWIEDDRFDDDYIMEDWYHKMKHILVKAEARGEE